MYTTIDEADIIEKRSSEVHNKSAFRKIRKSPDHVRLQTSL